MIEIANSVHIFLGYLQNAFPCNNVILWVMYVQIDSSVIVVMTDNDLKKYIIYPLTATE